MAKSSQKISKKLEIRRRRVFSEAFKKQQIEELTHKRITIKQLRELYGMSAMTVYRWLYRYSPYHQKGSTLVVQMESEAEKTKRLNQRVADLERVIGQKQMLIDLYEQIFEAASESLDMDVKKNFSTPPSNASAEKPLSTPTK